MTIAMQPVKSSQIQAIGHDTASNTLAVQFNSGSVYHYPNFTPDQFKAFSGAESIGKHFGANVKALPFEKQVKQQVNKGE